jgi:hypothetical protein
MEARPAASGGKGGCGVPPATSVGATITMEAEEGASAREDKGMELQRMAPAPARIGCPDDYSASSRHPIQPSKNPSAAPSRRRRSAPFPLSTFPSSPEKSTGANTAAGGPSHRRLI